MTDSEKNTEEKPGGKLVWNGGLSLAGESFKGGKINFLGGEEKGLTPTDALLLSLAGCMSMDIVSILAKKRVDIENYEVEIEGEKNTDYPKYFKSARMVIRLKGKGLDQAKLDRAVELSREKYCSVLHSLREGFSLEVKTVIEQ